MGCAAAADDAPAKFGTVDCRQAKCIALTFDAGPSENSAKLLDILKEKQVPATFFLLGKRHIEPPHSRTTHTMRRARMWSARGEPVRPKPFGAYG